MWTKEFDGINAFLVEMARLLLKHGVTRQTRGYNCIELEGPVMIKILNPTARLITIPERQWNFTLPYVESLWLASGRNDIGMVAHYLSKMTNFSDDQLTMRGGYGPRLRFFNGIADDYNTGYMHEHHVPENPTVVEIDQFEFVEKSFQKDPYTRQAIIGLGDPAKDCFSEEHILKRTKDFPCTRDIQFLKNNNKLDVIVHMRSNDFVWGASGVNIFNFTFMQEYFAGILGLEIGNYYHIANNFHFYDDQKELVQHLADTNHYEDSPYTYQKAFRNLAEFNERLMALQKYEYELRTGKAIDEVSFDDDFFNDWAKVLYLFNRNDNKSLNWANPILQKIIREKKKKKISANNEDQLKQAFIIDRHENTSIFWRQYI